MAPPNQHLSSEFFIIVHILAMFHITLAQGIHNAKTALSTPVCCPPVGCPPVGCPFCLTLPLDQIPQVHAPAPQGNSRCYGNYGNYSDRAGGGQSRLDTNPDGGYRAQPNTANSSLASVLRSHTSPI